MEPYTGRARRDRGRVAVHPPGRGGTATLIVHMFDWSPLSKGRR
ncbi:hypothetical protein ACQ4WX_43050 [Streptomyces lasalocidi]|nr:hypothetical protein [Streptomyces sp. MUSC 14]